MFHDIVRDMEVVSVFDERLNIARTRVAAEGNVRLNIRDGAASTVDGLLVDRLEEWFH